MSESPINTEEKKKKLDYMYLTLFERLLMGSSEPVVVNGEEILIDIPNLSRLMQDLETRKVVLSPFYVTEGKVSLEEASRVREQMRISSSFLTLFEGKFWPTWCILQDIKPSFKPGELDGNGQLIEFAIYPSRYGQRIELSQIALKDPVVNPDFKPVVNFLGEEDGAWRFRIKSVKEIKHELAPKAQNT